QRAMIHQDELSFEFGDDYVIVFSFDRKNVLDDDDFDDEYYSYKTIDKLSDIDDFLERINQFTAVTIKKYEFLGWREDLTEGKSITNEMYSFIKKINSYRKEAVLEYYTDIDYGDMMMCDDGGGNYFFSIQIVEDLWWDIE